MKDSSLGGGGGGGGGDDDGGGVPAAAAAEIAPVMTHQCHRNLNEDSTDATGVRAGGLVGSPLVKVDIVLQHVDGVARPSVAGCNDVEVL